MRSLGTRRAVQVAGAATVAVIALAGCSAGQTAETSLLQTPVSGINTASPDGGLLIRNLQVSYDSVTGYAIGDTAPIEASFFNQTQNPITVTITPSQQGVTGGDIVAATKVGILGGLPGSDSLDQAAANQTATPSMTPSDSASPSASASASAKPTAQPASITIPALGTVAFLGTDTAHQLQAIGLTAALLPGYSLSLNIQVSTSATPLQVYAPVAIPLSPASRGPGIPDENTEG